MEDFFPQAKRSGASLMGKVNEIGDRVLKGLRGEGVRPRQVWSVLEKEEVRSDWKTNQHSTFFIANRDGPGRGLNGRLFHECAGDRHVDDSGGSPETSLIINGEQLTKSTNREVLYTLSHWTRCAADRNNVYG